MEPESYPTEDRERVSCHLNAGACLLSLGKFKKALEHLDVATEVMKVMQLSNTGVDESGLDWSETQKIKHTTQDVSLLKLGAEVYYHRAIALLQLKRYPKAALSFKSSVDLHVRAGSLPQAAEALTSLALCYREQSDSGNEIRSLTNAHHLYSELGDVSNQAMVCVDLARAQLIFGRKDECEQLIEQSQTLCLRIHDKRIKGKLHSQYGLLYSSMRMFEEAIACFKRALQLVRRDKTADVTASTLQNIGAVYNERGMFSEAVEYHREAANLHEKLNNFSSQSKCLCNLAFAQCQLKDYPNAAHSFSLALTRARSSGKSYLLFQASEGLGAVCYHMGRHSEAVTHFKHALDVLEKIEEDTGIARERVMEKLSYAVEASQKNATNEPQDLHRDHLSTPARRVLLPPIQHHQQREPPVRKHVRVRQRPSLKLSDSYNADLTAYVKSYRESSPATTPQDSDNEQRGLSHSPTPTPVHANEGSLALGTNARELFTTHTTVDTGKPKTTKVRTEIVPITDHPTDPLPVRTDSHSQAVNGSKVCIVL